MGNGDERQLDAASLHERLESLVYMVLSVRRSVEEPARRLALLQRPLQDRFLHAVEYISRQTDELAFNFCMFGIDGLEIIDDDDWNHWVESLLDAYDQGGVLAAITAMQRLEGFIAERALSRTGVVRLEEVGGVLERFVAALSGRTLKPVPAAECYTDTECLFLPAALTVFPDREHNYRLFKAFCAHLWAQTWFGTWRDSMPERLRALMQRPNMLQWFHALETARLQACIERELPGLGREMQGLLRERGETLLPGLGAVYREALHDAAADAHTSMDLAVDAFSRSVAPPQPVCFQGTLHPARAEAVISRRRERDRCQLREALTHLSSEVDAGNREHQRGEPRRFTLPDGIQESAADMPVTLMLQGEPVTPLEDVQQVLASIRQDFGAIPNDWLVPAGSGAYHADTAAAAPEAAGDGTAPDALLYDEWDYLRGHYRKDWCQVRIRDVHPCHDTFPAETAAKYCGLLKHLYRTFEALRGEDRRLKRQPDGDAVDIDAVVETYADRVAGLEGADRLFVQRRRVDRDVAVMFLVDMSGSTKGWINDIERESLILLCETLEILGDRYAIYGFSGFTHKRCELLRIKTLDESYNDEVRARISGIRPQDYTHLGVFIRHLTRELQTVEAKTRMLITFSDGRPDDQDGYRGPYGIEDTRQALMEARHQGVHPYCITIDNEALEYLPHMYGFANFTLIDDVRRLPYRVSDIYRRLTG